MDEDSGPPTLCEQTHSPGTAEPAPPDRERARRLAGRPVDRHPPHLEISPLTIRILTGCRGTRLPVH